MKYGMFAVFCCIIVCTSCGSSGSDVPPLVDSAPAHPLLGEWTNTYLEVIMPTHNASDSIDTLIVTESDWESKLQIRPIRTFYFANGTYHSEHRDLNDSLVYDPAGKWFMDADSLSMTDTFPVSGLKYSYKVKISGSVIEFWGVEDFDQDGEADDRYYGMQEKKSR